MASACLPVRHPPVICLGCQGRRPAWGQAAGTAWGVAGSGEKNHQGSPRRSCRGIWAQMSERPTESWPEIGFVLGWEQGHCFSLEVYLLFRPIYLKTLSFILSSAIAVHVVIFISFETLKKKRKSPWNQLEIAYFTLLIFLYICKQAFMYVSLLSFLQWKLP